MLWDRIQSSLDNEAPYIDDTAWPEPCYGDEDPDPLYDCKRSYVDQVARFKRHQGKVVNEKPTAARPEIALAKQFRAEGLSYPQISAALAAQGYIDRKGKPYSRSSINYMLNCSTSLAA